MEQLSPTQRASVDRQLEPGERLLWAAGASGGMKAAPLLAGCFVVPLVLIGSWPLYVAVRAVPTMFQDPNGVIGVLAFGGFGLACALSALIAIWYGARTHRDLAATVWAVTDRRFFKLVERPGRRLTEAVPLRLVTGVDAVEHGDGSGSLTITTGAPHNVRRTRAGPRRGQYLIMGVRDVAAARTLIQHEVDRAVAEDRGAA